MYGRKQDNIPKDVTFIDNGARDVPVFEGFFNFLSHRTMCLGQDELIRNWYDVEPSLKQVCQTKGVSVPLRAILFHRNLPVDVRHNAKINRELLALWASQQLANDASLILHH